MNLRKNTFKAKEVNNQNTLDSYFTNGNLKEKY